MRKNLPGTLFLIVGNSGSGKDSIMQGAAKNYPNNLKKLYVPKRYITRTPTETEKSIPVSPKKFKIMSKKGRFALEWHIYGLDYGIPIEINDWLKKGHPVAVNVSRTVVPTARKIYNNVKVVFIEVPFKITLKRLKERGRETGKILKDRIERAKNNQKFPEADFTVNNAGQLEDAVKKFLNYVIRSVEEN